MEQRRILVILGGTMTVKMLMTKTRMMTTVTDLIVQILMAKEWWWS